MSRWYILNRDDALVSHTVAAIIEDFYKQNDQYIMTYICDSSDGRQMVRNTKFNSWFEYFSATDYLKIDKVITDADFYFRILFG